VTTISSKSRRGSYEISRNQFDIAELKRRTDEGKPALDVKDDKAPLVPEFAVNAEEAFDFYESVFGGEFSSLVRSRTGRSGE
jgi:hypothetical protein